jgi:arginine-tRNA-protein transferase
MEYKVRFRPLERLGPDGWQRLDAIAFIKAQCPG